MLWCFCLLRASLWCTAGWRQVTSNIKNKQIDYTFFLIDFEGRVGRKLQEGWRVHTRILHIHNDAHWRDEYLSGQGRSTRDVAPHPHRARCKRCKFMTWCDVMWCDAFSDRDAMQFDAMRIYGIDRVPVFFFFSFFRLDCFRRCIGWLSIWFFLWIASYSGSLLWLIVTVPTL